MKNFGRDGGTRTRKARGRLIENQAALSILHTSPRLTDAREESRTLTEQGLSLPPLPLGYTRVRHARGGTRTRTRTRFECAHLCLFGLRARLKLMREVRLELTRTAF